MKQHIRNIFHLGVKEIIELAQDKCMIILIIYAFTLGVLVTANGTPDSVTNAPIAVVDDDHTQISKRITDAFLEPIFMPPKTTTMAKADPGMDSGEFTFTVMIPPEFQKRLLSGKKPEILVNVDATRMSQAFVGAGYIEQIIDNEIKKFSKDDSGVESELMTLDLRNKFNPNLVPTWFGGVNQMISNVTMLAIVLIGAALIRERENGTLEHLLVMPVEPFEIMCAKVWSMLVVVLVATLLCVLVVLQGMLKMPIDGSFALFTLGVALHLFAVTSMGIFLACVAQNMPQMGMLFILVLMPMNMLSGGQTPRESMPIWVQDVMLAAPTTHFVMFSQQILFRGAGIEVAWKPFLWLLGIGSVLFVISLMKFKKTATQS